MSRAGTPATPTTASVLTRFGIVPTPSNRQSHFAMNGNATTTARQPIVLPVDLDAIATEYRLDNLAKTRLLAMFHGTLPIEEDTEDDVDTHRAQKRFRTTYEGHLAAQSLATLTSTQNHEQLLRSVILQSVVIDAEAKKTIKRTVALGWFCPLIAVYSSNRDLFQIIMNYFRRNPTQLGKAAGALVALNTSVFEEFKGVVCDHFNTLRGSTKAK
ncbi:hypothetical protein BT69DRAFT_1345234, partial [Atractiella rhizophila]